MTPLLLVALWLPVVGGLLAFAARRSPRLSDTLGIGSVIAASAAGIVPSLLVLAGAEIAPLRVAWSIPLGSYAIALDRVSAFFLLPIFVVASAAALYGKSYLRATSTAAAAAVGSSRIAASWLFYDLLVASMLTVVVARNGLLFLLAWEVMALSSFLLVVFHDEEAAARRAGWIYLVASHIGTAFLLAMFLLLARGDASLDFGLAGAASVHFGAEPGGSRAATTILLLALVGFGTKAGFVPLHVWLPEAHPAAPSHVSALMSGVMIKIGIYGIVRVTMLLGPPPIWPGWVLVGIGVTSGLSGVLFALAQHDLKRLLAYHSVENIGIIALGLGIGLLGRAHGEPALAILGFGGALFHVINHALFKGLLFLAAGSVAHGAGSREIDHLGGLLRRMPRTGLAFLIGSVAICGLPPLNGFLSEFLIYLGAFGAAGAVPLTMSAGGTAAIVSLALIGGLATACFTKAFGVVFLGEPRSHHAARAHDCGLAMRAGMMILAGGCVAIGLLAPWLLRPCAGVFGDAAGVSSEAALALVEPAARLLRVVVVASLTLIVLISCLAWIRWRLLAGRAVTAAPTWDCGYLAPAPRMQYSSSSYARPLTELFGFLLRTRRATRPPRGLFPERGSASLATVTPDLLQDRAYAPAFAGIARLAGTFRWVQGGRTQLYVLYIALTLLVLFLWKLG